MPRRGDSVLRFHGTHARSRPRNDARCSCTVRGAGARVCDVPGDAADGTSALLTGRADGHGDGRDSTEKASGHQHDERHALHRRLAAQSTQRWRRRVGAGLDSRPWSTRPKKALAPTRARAELGVGHLQRGGQRAEIRGRSSRSDKSYRRHRDRAGRAGRTLTSPTHQSSQLRGGGGCASPLRGPREDCFTPG